MQKSTKLRGVKGASARCALAAMVFLLAKYLLTALISWLMGVRVQGASLGDPIGYSATAVQLFQLVIGAGSLALPLLWVLQTMHLPPLELRLTIPGAWSPGFCITLFLGLASVGNLLGSLFVSAGTSIQLPSGGIALVLSFLQLCVLPAIAEELFFRGALQGLMRPSGSIAAIVAPALLFAVLHFDLAQSITALLCGLFLGWLAERTGSILPGMLLHFLNNTLAFLQIYLRLYAPVDLAVGFQLFVLLFFPVFAAIFLWQARRSGFRFSAGLRPGVSALSALTSPAYVIGVVFLVLFGIWQG